MNPYVRANRDLWDELTEINFRSAFYDVDGFRKEPPPLDPEVLAGLGDLAGKSVLHLQCHFGMDTMRIAKLARAAVGVDFSERAIERARSLAGDIGSTARFTLSDLHELALAERFDVAFSSYGVLGWLPDLEPWGRVIARHLAPGGRFFVIEGHPTMFMFDGSVTELECRYTYWPSPEPLVFPPVQGTYSDPTATVTHTEYTWPHTIAEVVNALIGAGLVIDEVREYAHVVWRAFPFLVETSHQRFVMPPDRPQIPLMFSVRAHAPE
jgi:SAM-dependent methyltransferase